MKDLIHSAIRKVTLELIYDAVDDRTQDIKERLGRVEGEITDLRHEMNRRFEAIDRRFEAMDQKFATLEQKIDQKFAVMDQKFDTLNARLDQLFALIVNQRKDS